MSILGTRLSALYKANGIARCHPNPTALPLYPFSQCLTFFCWFVTVALISKDLLLPFFSAYLTILFLLLSYLYILYKCNPLRVINSYFSHLWWSHIIILFQPLDLNESSYLGLPQPTKISYLFTWFYIAIWTIFMTELATKC